MGGVLLIMVISHAALETLFSGKARLFWFVCLPCDIVRKKCFGNMFRACFVFSAYSIFCRNLFWLSANELRHTHNATSVSDDNQSTKMAKKAGVLAHINLTNTGTLTDLHQGHCGLSDVRCREYRKRDIKSTSLTSIRVNFTAFPADNAKGRLYSSQTRRLFRKTIVFLCDFTVFGAVLYRSYIENVIQRRTLGLPFWLSEGNKLLCKIAILLVHFWFDS